ncbi:RICIN domain-containing protein [Candidatus Saccharibacteria bacterium]|nr:RICIN domain-containing protein [Candidatus Saccharibacteria bacterium]
MKTPHFTTKQILLACFTFAFVGTLSFLLAKNMNTTDATTAGFRPGNIMSDYVMGNYNTMNESQIQSFLNSKNSCNKGVSGGGYIGAGNDYGVTFNYGATYGDKYYHYHANGGKYICLGNERFNGKTAAHIIYRAAQDYHINPQVLLVLLQKEQSLITDQWPNTNYQYRSATGYGCPDTRPCDSEYYGLENQIRNAADLFRDVLNDDYNPYHSGRASYVQYSPGASCGGTNVYIENRATAALYRYTPYQPGGSGTYWVNGQEYSCYSYGNRNFYDFFTDWFGDTRTNSPNTNVTIPEGTYSITSALSNNIALDIAGGTDTANDQTNIQIYTANDTNAQRWQFIKNNDNTYTIKNPTTGKVLDVYGANTTNGTNIQLFTPNNTCAQKWYATKNTDNTYTFFSACSGLTIDVAGGKTDNSTNVQLYSSNNTKAQKWQLKPIRTATDGVYNITSKLSNNTTIDIAGGVKTANNKTNIQLYKVNHTLAQTWKVTYNTSDGYYTITNPATGKVLDVADGKTSPGANVQLYGSNNTCAQKWQITQNSDSSFSLYSACSGLALDVNNAKTNNGTNIKIWSFNGSNAQKWSLNSMQTISDGTHRINSSLDNNKVIDISGDINEANNRTNIQLSDLTRSNKQNWKFTYSDGYYTITNVPSNKVIDVADAGVTNSTNIQLYNSNNTCAQKWRVIKNSDNTYTFFSACSGLAIDVTGGNTTDGTNIQLYTANNTNAQKWRL